MDTLDRFDVDDDNINELDNNDAMDDDENVSPAQEEETNSATLPPPLLSDATIVIDELAATTSSALFECESNTRLKIRIKKWNSVGAWKWIANDDSCGICRMPFDACCGECKMPGDDCPLVFGKCSHPFHMHCIVKWLDSQTGAQLCPMCRQEWQYNA